MRGAGSETCEIKQIIIKELTYFCSVLKKRKMETLVANAPLNDTQIMLLQTFSQIESEQEKEDIQSLLLTYFQKRVDTQASHFLWYC
jgi:hypothetical protein